MPKYLVEALSQYRMVYAVEADSPEIAQSLVHLDLAPEFGQMWLGEMTVSHRRVEDDELVEIHDELNDYLKHLPREEKLARVYKAAS